MERIFTNLFLSHAFESSRAIRYDLNSMLVYISPFRYQIYIMYLEVSTIKVFYMYNAVKYKYSFFFIFRRHCFNPPAHKGTNRQLLFLYASLGDVNSVVNVLEHNLGSQWFILFSSCSINSTINFYHHPQVLLRAVCFAFILH